MKDDKVNIQKINSGVHLHLSRKSLDDITITVNDNHIIILSREPLEISKSHANKITLRFAIKKKTAD